MIVAELASPEGVKVSVNDAAAEVLISSGWAADKSARKPSDKK